MQKRNFVKWRLNSGDFDLSIRSSLFLGSRFVVHTSREAIRRFRAAAHFSARFVWCNRVAKQYALSGLGISPSAGGGNVRLRGGRKKGMDTYGFHPSFESPRFPLGYLGATERKRSYLEVGSSKGTGIGFRFLRCCGVVAGHGSAAQYNAAAQYATALGLAFQIRDDMLDVLGDAKTLGKAVHVDEKKGTFVRLYGLERCGEMIAAEGEKAEAALEVFEDPAFLKELVQKLTVREF